MRIVLGVAGGIAAYKACSLLRLFTEAGHDVTVVPTASALRFVGAPTWAALSGKPVTDAVWDDVEQVRHVKLGQEADLVVVAPATADLLARAAHGMANDLLTNVLLTASCPVLLAPAMHTEMWQHPATRANVALLRERGVLVIDPASGRLTGKDSGPGRLPEPEQIFDAALAATRPVAQDLAGVSVLISAGGTREPLDPVRYLGNRSSGKQGYALAQVAAARGAKVTLVSTVDLPAPEGVDVQRVETADQLRERVLGAAVDVIIMAAAVADFRPAKRESAKIKKTFDPAHPDDAPTITLVRNPDILAQAVQARGAAQWPVLVGFAAETGDAGHTVLEHARAKLARKGCDLLVANEVGEDITFGQDTSTVYLLRADGGPEITVGPADKREIAAAVLDAVGDLILVRRSV
ncbi:phosphopantothenate-cysteine ligase /phosphopantothenoylcysteine decarboxylase [Branchiibius hedensis]|uniref:Coenzyme A biosynthesis bifunctional protein CoaBC n=1 Tax=Branchiibius hedensis TaxID=672460 RepID=A0A2Y8ZP66_9MICO|nr:bifunctional phosphopantothenoylcysteine decarboxylase/phosphopantothenate--cysteine ligase CoaBC [Branchiibius hedensis]PWJ25337.1 phosphopantothenate-cysteine ligase /phosphopantothenoylcysteine decarboxylase [Branchiibius hedensis]SSA34151.1 Phosphopantothenate-cysteine ligase /Phosphopantothenoylcysteine decarboxylase [Branchiibius hedensis]